MSGYIIYVGDTETTGMDPTLHDVIEISLCRFSMDSPEDRDQRTWYLRALNPTTIQEEALKVNGHKREDIIHFTAAGKEKYKEPSEVVLDIENWIMEDDVSVIDRMLVGQNIAFDIRMLKELWKRVDASDTFPWDVDRGKRALDTQGICNFIDLCTGRRRRYTNLGTLVKAFGVKKRKAHKAEDDVAMTTDLLIKMLEPLVTVATEEFSNCYTDLDQ
ncbi:MAG: 3'-5' exonuclease [Candidatus Hermodarchaeia archaeon]|jgi:DNA polymerase III epsilon subunit-like protein